MLSTYVIIVSMPKLALPELNPCRKIIVCTREVASRISSILGVCPQDTLPYSGLPVSELLRPYKVAMPAWSSLALRRCNEGAGSLRLVFHSLKYLRSHSSVVLKYKARAKWISLLLTLLALMAEEM